MIIIYVCFCIYDIDNYRHSISCTRKITMGLVMGHESLNFIKWVRIYTWVISFEWNTLPIGNWKSQLPNSQSSQHGSHVLVSDIPNISTAQPTASSISVEPMRNCSIVAIWLKCIKDLHGQLLCLGWVSEQKVKGCQRPLLPASGE